MNGYNWLAVGLCCLGILIVMGLMVQRSREQERGRQRIKKLQEEEDARLLREAQRQTESHNPAQGKTRGLGNVSSGYTGSLASKLERNAPPPPPTVQHGGNGTQRAGGPLTRDVRTQQRGHIPSSSSVRDVHHHHEQDNTIPYLVAAAVLLSDSNDNCRESYSPPQETSSYNDRSCSPSDNTDYSSPSGDD